MKIYLRVFGKSANFFVPKIEHAIVFLSLFDTVF